MALVLAEAGPGSSVADDSSVGDVLGFLPERVEVADEDSESSRSGAGEAVVVAVVVAVAVAVEVAVAVVVTVTQLVGWVLAAGRVPMGPGERAVLGIQ